jgi:cyclophilin family peptidyl-prolyl cis-trans isomerase
MRYAQLASSVPALLAGLLLSTDARPASRVMLETPFGEVEIELFDEQAPQTVANFLNYVNDGDYRNSFIHRSVPGFVIQGGGYTYVDGVVDTIPTDPPVPNEPGISNLRGTVAMAKLSGDPDSATSQWYINLDDNSADLDSANGGFTVFGQVIGEGMQIVDQIAELEIWNAGSPFNSLPLIDYPGTGDITDQHLVMVDLSEVSSSVLNAGHSGAWYNPSTPGQGVLVEVDEGQQFLFASWFTFTPGGSGSGAEQHWLTAQGSYSGDAADLLVYETLGGEFDDPQDVTTEAVGQATLRFSDCANGELSYVLDHWGLQGVIPLERAIPASDSICQQRSEQVTQAVDINGGMDGAWFDPETAGQGILFDVEPDASGSGFMFAAWFTFGQQTTSGQRWLTAQGTFEGSAADLEVFETTGGVFDDPAETLTEAVGVMRVEFSDCGHARLSYGIDEGALEGLIELERALPQGSEMCEELDAQN